MKNNESLSNLLNLSHNLGDPSLELAILGEGNTSAQIDNKTFLVKASGSCLATLQPTDVVECQFEPLLSMLQNQSMSDQEIVDGLMLSRVDSTAKKPSVEALFHAYLLSLPEVQFVGHTHSVSINQILCSPQAKQFALHKLFPDDVVCCGTESVFVPYTDPGLKLSQVIQAETTRFMQKHKTYPRVILLENHGIITLGSSPQAVEAAMLMADKAAKIFVGTFALGGPSFLKAEDVHRIANRIDEHYRQRALQI
ncbi:MAG: class II aldolase/adducin family protein [Pirellulaceae bacterium]|nr:class II aldolase/adducin family protein [Pirellulaceae bacterium]